MKFTHSKQSLLPLIKKKVGFISEGFFLFGGGGIDFYNGYFVTVAEEQDFNRIMDKSPNHIYIVVKFLSASINYGQLLLPITITAISEDRKLNVCKKLLFEYSDINNLKLSNDETIKQFYTSPQVMSNFEEIYDGYRSLLTLSGTFLINRNANPYKYYLNVFTIQFKGDVYNITINEKKFFETIKAKKYEFYTIHEFINDPQGDNNGNWEYKNKGEFVDIFHPNEFSNTLNLHAARAECARNAYRYYAERLKNEGEAYRKQLEAEVRTRLRMVIDKRTGKPKRVKEKYLHGKYFCRGKNKQLCQKLGIPWVYDKLAIMAVSVFHLAHNRPDVTVESYLTAK